jgi:hypothetical protein
MNLKYLQEEVVGWIYLVQSSPVATSYEYFNEYLISMKGVEFIDYLRNYRPGYPGHYSDSLLVGWSGVRILALERYLSLLQNVHTGCGAHSDSYSMDNWARFPGSIAAEALRWPLAPRSRMSGALPPLFMPLLRVQEQLFLYLTWKIISCCLLEFVSYLISQIRKTRKGLLPATLKEL